MRRDGSSIALMLPRTRADIDETYPALERDLGELLAEVGKLDARNVEVMADTHTAKAARKSRKSRQKVAGRGR